MKTGLEIIADEQDRIRNKEGFSVENDGQYTRGELALAATSYAMTEKARKMYQSYSLTGGFFPRLWPWSVGWWKPTPNDRVRELAKAGALIACEIDRLNNL